MGIRIVTRGSGERTSARNIRSDEKPQVNKIYEYSGNIVDIVTNTNGTILKFKSDFSGTPTWTFAQTGSALQATVVELAAVRGYFSRGVGIGSFNSAPGQPQFVNIPPVQNPTFYLQSLLSSWKRSSVSSGMMSGNGNRPDFNGTLSGSFDAGYVARGSGNTFLGGVSAINAIAPQNFGQIRSPGVGIINCNVINRGIVKFNNSFNRVTTTTIGFNPSSLNLVINPSGLFIRAEQAESYGRIDYSCADTNKLNKARFIMLQKQLSKLILNTFRNPLLK